MKLITTRDQIRTVAERWYNQYGSRILQGCDLRTQAYKLLLRLDKETATTQQVCAIIGNDSWCQLGCDECGLEVDAVVQIGAEPDYESNTATICQACLQRATGLFPTKFN